tara:strand:+ start:33 stop:1400 length:1368 start_codon:yes stop_codon:yes gene_type:complete
MSQYITSKVASIKYTKGALPFDDKTYYYKEQTYVTGTPGNYTYETSILRSEDASFDVTTVIGTRGVVGAITLDDDFANEDEKKYLTDTLLPGLKTTSLDLNTKVNETLVLGSGDKQNLLKGLGLPYNTNEVTPGELAVNLAVGTQLLTEAKIEGRVFRKQYAHFCYPNNLRTNKQDRIRFEQIYTEGTKIDTNFSNNQRAFQRKTKKVRGSVTLPIVTGIGDRTEVDWQGQTLNPLQSAGAAIALDVFNRSNEGEGANALVNAGVNALSQAKALLSTGTVGSDVRSGINVWLAQKAVGAQGLLSRTTGAIVNPNLEMLFSGPKLRNFGFTFRLSARDVDEAGQVRKILRFFKQGMSVKTSSSNVFLKAPNIFKIKYQTFNTEGEEITHPSLNIFKTCALTSCDVQYTPDGNYMTYEDPHRTLTSYQLSLSFSELDPIFDSDYTALDNDNDTVMGY